MIGPVELEQVALLLGLRREQHRLDGLGPGQERAGVAPPGQVFFPGIGETGRGILAYRFVEAEPGPGPARVRLQQRRGDELLDQRVNLAGPDRRRPRHLPRRGKVEPAGEYAQPPEYHRRIGRQQRMTPAQARLQRVMAPGARGPGRPSRRPQPLGEFGQRGNPQAVGDQFERQRKPARLAADAARQHQLAGPVRHRHPRHGGPGQEQRHRLRRNRMAGLAGNSHGLHPPHAFGLDIERDAARHQNPQIRGPPGQLLAGAPGRFQHMLAVVDNQQRPAGPTPPRPPRQAPPRPRPP